VFSLVDGPSLGGGGDKCVKGDLIGLHPRGLHASEPVFGADEVLLPRVGVDERTEGRLVGLDAGMLHTGEPLLCARGVSNARVSVDQDAVGHNVGFDVAFVVEH